MDNITHLDAAVAARPSDAKPNTANAKKTKAAAKQSQSGARFTLTDKGVFYLNEDDEAQWICAPLRITAQACDEEGYGWGKLLEFTDAAGIAHNWPMPLRLLAGDGSEIRAQLLDAGLIIAPGRRAREWLMQYIQTTTPAALVRSVEQTGWCGGVYVLPDGQIGPEGAGQVLLNSATVRRPLYTQAGTLEDWQQHVAALCLGNTRLIFSVSVAFAAPLLGITGDENGGFHWRGPSSIGKTMLLRVAQSVYGGPTFITTWRATSNGLEGSAALRNDALLLLDELGQVLARIAGETAYMLANGQGKQRATRYGFARLVQTWRLLFLSTGETSLVDRMSEDGQTAKAGQETRLADIPADTGKYGAFETLHHADKGAAFADHIRQVTGTCYGIPLRAFLEAIVAQEAAVIRQQIETLIDEFIASLGLPTNTTGQVLRVARRFALVAAAGELASELKVTGWEVGTALTAAAACFKAWLNARGGVGNLEDQKALEQVRLFFEQHGESRFTDWIAPLEYHQTPNRAGFKRRADEGTEFYVLAEVFKKEICKGLDAPKVARLLADHGWIHPDHQGKTTAPARLPGSGGKLTRVYHFTTKVLGGIDDD